MFREKLAVIGSGIAGLSASFFLAKKFDVCLLEKNNYLGGHTRTKKIIENSVEHYVDTGFIVFNSKNYPDLTNFFNFLNIETGNSSMSFSVSLKEKNLEYGGSNFNSIFAQRKNILSINFLLLINEIRKLYKHCSTLINEKKFDKFTINEFLDYHNYSERIKYLHLYPMISSIWSSNAIEVRNFPFISFKTFFHNHGLFSFKNRPQWKYVKGGSVKYVENLVDRKLFDIKINFSVKKVIRESKKIIIIDEKNNQMLFDKVIIATHADQALLLLDKPSENEKKILSKFKYNTNTAYLHSDKRYMPIKNSAWSSWNFIGDDINKKKFSLTYWMNNLQKINSRKNFFVTINPHFIPKNFYDYTLFEHPIFNLDTIESQRKISEIQGYLNTYYCGSYCGFGFHEDGIQSAAYIAKNLNIKLPWVRDENFVNRLYYFN